MAVGDPVVIRLDPPTARHLTRALDDYRKRCRSDGLRLPAALEELLSVTAGQGRTDREAEAEFKEAEVMTSLRLFTFDEVSERLRLSERSVRRLVATGELQVVEVSGRRRIHPDDLENYLGRLRERGAERRSS